MSQAKDGSPEQRGLLNPNASTTPEVSTPSASIASPYKPSPTRHRPGYARVPSVSIIDEQYLPKRTMDSADEEDITKAAPVDGLGIAYGSDALPKAHRVNVQQIRRTPTEQKRTSSPLASPPSTGSFSGTTQYDASPQDFDADTAYVGSKHASKQSASSLHSIQPSIYAKSDAGLLSVRSKYDDFQAEHHCRSHNRIKQRMGNWLSITILILAIFSTVFSLAFLILAVRGPRYGRRIYSRGSLTAGTAAFLTSFFAKLIELSFVTVVVAFLGQALARRAFKQGDVRGVTLAEISMRSWIVQPGTMITNWQSVRYAGITSLGIISLFAALNAILYSSAATALVQPQLKFPGWSSMMMQGLVKTEFANPTYIRSNCKTPITVTQDPQYNEMTCIDLQFASLGYHNYFTYLNTWADLTNNGTATAELSQRPKGFALANDNTSVTAPWVEFSNMTDNYVKHGLIVNNVSMAMPHPGIMQAAIDPVNNIMQPEELDGLGVYNIIASVPSPVIHVLCVTMNQTQLKPLVYSQWDQNVNKTVNMTTWPNQLAYADPYLNSTPFDDVFGWGPKYGQDKWPPVFGILPQDYNTLVNDTIGVSWGREAIYVLGKGGPTDNEGSPTNDQNYGLCQLQVSWTANCSTRFNASSSGSKLEAVCDDFNDQLRFVVSNQSANSGSSALSKDWPNIGGECAKSLSLNAGVSDGNASNARLLTQLIIPNTGISAANPPQLNAALPSLAEALAVMFGSTLLLSAIDAPFREYWNYTLTTTSGQYQSFNTSIRAQQYASGGTQNYQKGFYVILFLTFIMNLLILIYLCVHRDWYTDFSEPTTLFSLAVNSPPSKEMAGSCGGGPQGDHFRVSWKLNSEGDHVYMESRERDHVYDSPGLKRRTLTEGFDMVMTPVRKATERLDKRRST